jgi:hypothetical protein
MPDSEARKKRLEQVALLTERLHTLEDLLAKEHDARERESYETEKAEILTRLRQIRRA